MNLANHLKNTWKEHQQVWGQQEVEASKEKIMDSFTTMFAPGPYYYYIFNFTNSEFDYVYHTANELLPIDDNQHTFEAMTKLIHPEDVPHMMNCEYMLGDFFTNKIEPHQICDYKISYLYRMKTRKGYHLTLHQARVLTQDESGGVSKVFVLHSSIQHLVEANNYKISFFGLKGLPSYLGVPVQKRYSLTDTIQHPFSNRELEVIRLLADGQSNKMIATLLKISLETVRTHRKNILEKSNCDNSLHLVAHCIRNGII